MSCLNCFYSPDFQKKMKCSTHEIERFEERLEKYKELYIDEINKLTSIGECSCEYSNINNLEGIPYEDYVHYTDAYLNVLKSNTQMVQKIFDSIINTYKLYFAKSYKHAAEQFWTIINELDLAKATSNSIFNENLFFRARINDGKFDTSEPREYFHIPFNKRHFIKNQRFSVSGQPMSYFGNSLLAVTKELETPINDLAVAAFIPTYGVIKNINELSNSVFELLVNNLPGIFGAGSFFEFKPEIALKQIKETILCEILTFPAKEKGNFIEEYVLPQMYTTLLIENGWQGIKFPSTKDYTNIDGAHRFSKYNYNFAIFINYDEVNNYDEKLFEKFIPILLEEHLKDLTSKDMDGYDEEICRLNNEMHTSCVAYFAHAKLQVDYLKKASIDGIKYYDTEIGKTELNFFAELYNFTLHMMNIQYNEKSKQVKPLQI